VLAGRAGSGRSHNCAGYNWHRQCCGLHGVTDHMGQAPFAPGSLGSYLVADRSIAGLLTWLAMHEASVTFLQVAELYIGRQLGDVFFVVWAES
jgi:hypothetical protein